MHFWRSAIGAFLFSVILAVPSSPAVHSDEEPAYDVLASHVAAAIRESTKGAPQGAAVLVLDFGPATELGHSLSVEFDTALRKHSQGFVVLDAADLKEAAERHHLPETTLSSKPAMICYAPDLGATVYIEGSLESGPDEVQVEITAIQVTPRKTLFKDDAKFKMTPSMLQLAEKLAPAPPPVFTNEEKIWVNPNQATSSTSAPTQAGKPALPNSLPECSYCPGPSFSDDAIYAKFGGEVTLRVQIRKDGIPAKITLVQGLPCGLSDQALEAVECWRFKPATGPTGAPVAVIQTVEVTFRMY